VAFFEIKAITLIIRTTTDKKGQGLHDKVDSQF